MATLPAPSGALLPVQASAAGSGKQPQQAGADGPAGWRRLVLLAGGLLAVWALLAAAGFSWGPLFLVKPPITRCAA
jgi:hypothetical protein